MPTARKITPSPTAFRPAAAIAPAAEPVSLLCPPPHTPPGMVTATALMRRINRRLAPLHQRLGRRADRNGYRFELVDLNTGDVLEERIDLEARALQLGCLKPGERIA